VIQGIKDALKKAGVTEVKYAFDAVSQNNSFQNISKVLAPQGSKITLVIPGKDYSDIPASVERSTTLVSAVHQANSTASVKGETKTILGGKDFGYVYFRLFSRGLQEGWFIAHPYEVIPGGLHGVEKGLSNLKNGVNSATKYVFKIADTK
jgi:NADPH2:quinone reductase